MITLYRKLQFAILLGALLPSVLCAQDATNKYRFGFSTGLGASIIISQQKSETGKVQYQTPIGSGFLAPDFYLHISKKLRNQQLLMAKLGYYQMSAHIPVNATLSNSNRDSMFARDVEANYNMSYIHLPVDYSFYQRESSNGNNTIYYTVGVDIAYCVAASSKTKLQPLNNPNYLSYSRSVLDKNTYRSTQFGMHLSWHLDKKLTETTSLIAGYIVTFLPQDFTQPINITKAPFKYEDGINRTLQNLFYIGLMF
jgi:hypothetical protein